MNRIIQWEDDAITYEADQRHAELTVQHLGLGDKTNSVVTPGVKRANGGDDEDEEGLSEQDATKYRALAARAMFLAQDRTDIGYAVKELSRRMSKPRIRDMKDMKRLGRYLIGREKGPDQV